jgi:predicted metal-dependent hydrolase
LKSDTAKIVTYKDIGTVAYIRKGTARNLKISLRPFKGVQVTVPGNVSYETAEKFVITRMGWIMKQRERMKKYENRVTLFTEDTRFHTRDHVLSIGKHDKSTVRTVIRDKMIRVDYPGFAQVEDSRIQQAVRKAIIEALRLEAQRYLPEMTKELALRFGFTYSQLSLRNNKTRWGSCSHGNNISLNIHLMRLPVRLQEYIILHELCHTVHRHHQKSFWQLLDKVTGGQAREMDKSLNTYSPHVF